MERRPQHGDAAVTRQDAELLLQAPVAFLPIADRNGVAVRLLRVVADGAHANVPRLVFRVGSR